MQMDLPKRSLKVTPKSSENSKTGTEMICLWDENTKIAMKIANCVTETAKIKGHDSFIAEVLPAKMICEFSLLFYFFFRGMEVVGQGRGTELT